MTKRQIIDDIRRYNITAHPNFLAQFDESALKQYLNHLEAARHKHLRKVVFTTIRRKEMRMVS